MTPQRPPTVSVIEPISPAFEKVKTILFSPFDLRKWFVIGFCAWLAYLGKVRESGLINTYEKLVQAKEYIHENLAWIITVAVAASVLIIVLWLVFIWLSSRGRFIFLHCVAENKAEVTVPWTKFQQHANSLFLFRIVLGLIGFAAIGLPLLLAGGIIAIIVVPIMFLRTTSCVAGWREFLTLLSVNKARFALYILFQIVIALVIFSIISMGFYIGLCFCCVSFLLFVPYIRTVILLPVLVFKRAYSLLYLGQFGPEFDVFRPETEMALPG